MEIHVMTNYVEEAANQEGQIPKNFGALNETKEALIQKSIEAVKEMENFKDDIVV